MRLGAFLVAAMKTLINVYAAVIGKIKFLAERNLTEWLTGSRKSTGVSAISSRNHHHRQSCTAWTSWKKARKLLAPAFSRARGVRGNSGAA